MSIYLGNDFCIFSSTNDYLEVLRQISRFQNHRNFGKKVFVKKPKFIPCWLCKILFKNFGVEGNVFFIEYNDFYKRDIYSVLFDVSGESITCFYFEDDLEFKS